MRIIVIVLSVLSLLAAWGPAFADDCEAPCAGYEISADLQNDWIFSGNPSSLTSNNLYPSISTDLFLAPTDAFRFVASITTEQVIDPAPGSNTVFHGTGAYAEELYAVLDADPVVLRAGKINTVFSLASEADPGINAMDIATSIDADERWGVEAVLGFEALDFKHSIAATVFTVDRTFLSNSIFNKRGATNLSDGGPGNVAGIGSAAITLSGCKGAEPADCYDEGDFGYRAGFRFQRAGHASPDQIEEDIKPVDEFTGVAAATAKFDVGDMTVRLLGETALVRGFESNPDDALIMTGSAALEIDAMTYTAAFSQQKTYVKNDADTINRLLEISAVYRSEDDVPFDGASWSAGAAYDCRRDADAQTAHVLSLLLSFTFGGSHEFGK